MHVRLSPVMLLPLAFAALLAPAQVGATATAHTDGAPVPAAAAETLFVQLKIQTNGKTLKHPGHKMETGEELVLVLKEGKKKHEAVVYVESTDAGFDVELTYTAGGTQKLKATKAGKDDSWLTFETKDGSAKVHVKVKAGNKRKDGIDVGGGDNPLDGLD